MIRRHSLTYGLALGIIGVFLSFFLIWHHGGGGQTFSNLVCGPETGCDTLNRSVVSEFLGLPVAFWGAAFYIFTVFSFLFLRKFDYPKGRKILLYVCIFAFLVDIFLLLYSIFWANAFCVLCGFSYLITLGLLICAFYTYKTLPVSLKKPHRFDFLIYASYGFIILTFGGLIQVYGKSDQEVISEKPKADIALALDQFVNKALKVKENKIPEAIYIIGPTQATMRIVSFSDNLCPFCRFIDKILKEFQRKHLEKVSIESRSYPLDQNCNPAMKSKFHDGACRLANAIYCAGEQKKYWEVTDLIYNQQDKWPSKNIVTDSDIKRLLKSTDLDFSLWQNCYDNGDMKQSVSNDIILANKLGVNSTPTIFINGKQINIPSIQLFPYILERILLKLENGS